MDYSEDAASAPQGGDLGFVSASALGRVAPPLRAAVLGSQPGTVKDVPAGGGHTLVLMLAREAAGQRELTDPTVRENIRDAVRQGKEQVLRTAYFAAARNDAKVVNYLARQVVDAQGKLPGLAPATPGKK
jgi:peptidyl-prolyl cis-trans isomerase SurA